MRVAQRSLGTRPLLGQQLDNLCDPLLLLFSRNRNNLTAKWNGGKSHRREKSRQSGLYRGNLCGLDCISRGRFRRLRCLRNLLDRLRYPIVLLLRSKNRQRPGSQIWTNQRLRRYLSKNRRKGCQITIRNWVRLYQLWRSVGRGNQPIQGFADPVKLHLATRCKNSIRSRVDCQLHVRPKLLQKWKQIRRIRLLGIKTADLLRTGIVRTRPIDLFNGSFDRRMRVDGTRNSKLL